MGCASFQALEGDEVEVSHRLRKQKLHNTNRVNNTKAKKSNNPKADNAVPKNVEPNSDISIVDREGVEEDMELKVSKEKNYIKSRSKHVVKKPCLQDNSYDNVQEEESIVTAHVEANVQINILGEEGLGKDMEGQAIKKYNLRNCRPKNIENNYNLEANNINGDETEDENAIPEHDEANVAIESSEDEEGEIEHIHGYYKGLKTKIKWSEVAQDSSSERTTPAWLGNSVHLSTGDILEPIDYFSRFFGNDLVQLIANETNRYALQCDIDKTICITNHDIQSYIGIGMYMSLVRMSRTRMYWGRGTEINAVRETMSRDRFEEIKRFLHFSDNEKAPAKGDPLHDRLFKVRPLLDHIKGKFNEIPISESLSMDEQVIPYTGKCGPRYYIKNKPNPWGFKVWTLADSFGIVHDFEFCVAPTPRVEGFPDLGSCANTVLQLSTLVPRFRNHKLFVDNYFSNIPLYMEMEKLGIQMVGTVRIDRCPGFKNVCISDKDLRALGKSAFKEYEAKLDERVVRICRWFDNNLVTFIYTLGSAQPETEVLRWARSDPSNNKKVAVKAPNVVTLYNRSMGGVDKIDMLIALYRIFFKSKKWYHRIFWHMVDECVCNAWLLYRRDWDASARTGRHLNLMEFKFELSYCLRKQHKPCEQQRRVGRPTIYQQNNERRKFRIKRTVPMKPVREDGVGHSPVALKRRARCNNIGCKRVITTFCIKCKLHLCIKGNDNRQCFLEFHGVEFDTSEYE